MGAEVWGWFRRQRAADEVVIAGEGVFGALGEVVVSGAEVDEVADFRRPAVDFTAGRERSGKGVGMLLDEGHGDVAAHGTAGEIDTVGAEAIKEIREAEGVVNP
jgi:hypothetical protein